MPHTLAALIGAADDVECILIAILENVYYAKLYRTPPGPPSQRRDCETSALLISCRSTLPQCGLSAITANQQQSMGIQLVHLKGRGALEAFMVLVRYKNYKTQLAIAILT